MTLAILRDLLLTEFDFKNLTPSVSHGIVEINYNSDMAKALIDHVIKTRYQNLTPPLPCDHANKTTRGMCAACYQQWYKANAEALAIIKSDRLIRRQNALTKHFYRVAQDRSNVLRDEVPVTKVLNEQKRRCAICRRLLDPHATLKRNRPVKDHCHATGKFRSLLCHHCNLLIGFCREDIAVLRAAIKYLKHHRK